MVEDGWLKIDDWWLHLKSSRCMDRVNANNKFVKTVDCWWSSWRACTKQSQTKTHTPNVGITTVILMEARGPMPPTQCCFDCCVGSLCSQVCVGTTFGFSVMMCCLCVLCVDTVGMSCRCARTHRFGCEDWLWRLCVATCVCAHCAHTVSHQMCVRTRVSADTCVVFRACVHTHICVCARACVRVCTHCFEVDCRTRLSHETGQTHCDNIAFALFLWSYLLHFWILKHVQIKHWEIATSNKWEHVGSNNETSQSRINTNTAPN